MALIRDALSLPLTQVKNAAQRLAQRGAAVFQQARCQGCGQETTRETPNVIAEWLYCGKCGHVTNLVTNGCGYSVSIIKAKDIRK